MTATPSTTIRRRLPMIDEPEVPALLGLRPEPTLARRAVHLPDSDELSPRAFDCLSAVRDALLAGPTAGGAVFSLDAFAADERTELWEVLGEGEVSVVVIGASRYEIDETALPGVFRVRTRADGTERLHLEVGAVPAIVLAAAEHGTSLEMPLEDPPPEGLMNAQPLLAELRHRMAMHPPDAPNHVVSLTLLPLNEADARYLARALGVGPVTAVSRGYGTCRVTATARRGIWSVQYFSAMDALILDTLEVGAVPGALLAAPVNLEDSGARLSELLNDAGRAR